MVLIDQALQVGKKGLEYAESKRPKRPGSAPMGSPDQSYGKGSYNQWLAYKLEKAEAERLESSGWKRFINKTWGKSDK